MLIDMVIFTILILIKKKPMSIIPLICKPKPNIAKNTRNPAQNTKATNYNKSHKVCR